MKVLLLTLLVLSLCSIQVLTLKCYTCVGTDCKVVENCATEKVHCRTYAKGDVLERACEQFCAEDDFTTCCQQDLCIA
ncbi:uncharacterized protein LOC141771335 [Sebastes fasciatus]|uniref:uncharacterized protein LOC141771335 n=1 Tax=Sebastes fasciatus TaxID=394691 RepID=UPI003D9DB44B